MPLLVHTCTDVATLLELMSLHWSLKLSCDHFRLMSRHNYDVATLYLVVLQSSPNVFTDVATFIRCHNIRLNSLSRLLGYDVVTLAC